MKLIRQIGILIGFCLSSGFLPAQVFVWQGNTPNWNDLANWSALDGEDVNELPGPEDHVIFPSAVTEEVHLPLAVEVSSITALNAENLSFSGNSTMTVSGSFLIHQSAQVSHGTEIVLTGESHSSPRMRAPASANITTAKNYLDYQVNQGTRGSCGFFTLTPDPTPPTCNGFDDGIASVLEPTGGVGPYTYQWIGGPATRVWNGVGAGTYTIIVIDLGQGGVPCNIDVFVNEPGPLTLFALNGVAPTCADICNGQASPIVIGGNGGYSLTWSSGETGLNPTALCSTFQLTIEDSEGCTADTTVTFNNLPDPIVIDATVTGITCFGFDDGAIDLQASGGTGTLTFDWTGPGGFTSTSEDISSLEPGDYEITVTDDNSCSETATFEIVENPELILSTSPTDNLCNADLTGAIDLTISGGLPPYAVSWSGPGGFSSTDEDISGLQAGLYEATITDAANCIQTIQQEVNQPTALSAVLNSVDLLCFEDNTGEVSATASGGTPPYSYDWTGPNGFTASGPGQTGLEAGTYDLVVTDDNSCTFNGSILVNQPADLTGNISESPISCQGDADGELDLTLSGGTAPYNFTWSGPGGFSSANEDISGLGPGTYTVDILDDNGCSLQLTYDLTEPVAISLAAVLDDPDCAAGSTGSIDLSVANGTAPYTFAWTGPGGFSSSAEDISGVGAGDYTVVVDDVNGCSATQTFTLSDPANLDATFDVTPVSCRNGNDGAITTTPSGGTTPYTFLWLGPGGFNSTSQNISNLQAGSYSLLISDANGCNAFFSVNVSQPTNLTVSFSITDVTCFGDANGGISISPSGATPPYSFSWTGPNGFSSTDEDITGLEGGDYVVEITDANDCVFTRSYTVDEPGEITIDGAITDVTCVGESTGAIDITVNGGTPGFLYSWSGPNGFSTVSEDISNLEAGTYTIEITDAQGCVANETFQIQELFEVLLDIQPSDISCFGAGDGAIEITASGGSEPYQFAWSGPNGFSSNDEDLSGLEAGTYSVEVIDANGCEASGQATINEPNEITVSTSSSDITCFGDADGTAESTVSGGTPPLSTLWTGPNGFTSSSGNISNLEGGEYVLVVTDGEGCSVTDTVNIAEPDELVVTTTFSNPDCLVSNGEASASASGGVVSGDYSYEWTTAGGTLVGTTATITGLGEGVYTITVTDDNGCTAQASVILQTTTFDVSAAVSPTSCPGGSDGTIDISVLGGTTPYTFSWTGPNGYTSTDEDISSLQAGEYFLAIEDATGCTFNMSYDVNQPESLVFNGLVDPETCPGAADGSIEIQLEGGTLPYSYSWTSNGGFTSDQEDIFNLTPDTYTLTINDGNNCLADTTIEVISLPGIVIDPTITNVDCFGDASGAIDLGLSGGTAPYEVSWTGPAGFNSDQEDISDLSAGTYDVVVEDVNGCSASDSYEITEGAEIILSTEITGSNCQQADGLAVATATGGTGVITFTWEDLDGNELAINDSLIDVTSGTYVVTATDELGCTVTETIGISDQDGTVDGLITPPTCSGGSDAAIDITVSGGTEPYSFEWSDGLGVISTQEDLTDLTAGTYSVQVTDDNGCIFAQAFEVIDPDAIVVIPTIEQVSCAGNDGSVSVEIQNAAEPITVSWTGPDGFVANGTTISDLETGTYSYAITDSNGCAAAGDIEVTDAPAISVSEEISDVACNGEADGSIELDVLTGTGPFTFAWTGPNGFISDLEDIFNLEGGDYEVTITDGQGCPASFSYTVAEPEALSITFNITQPDCNTSNGTIEAVISGGTVSADYAISWTDESGTEVGTTALLENVAAGIYDLIVIDDNGCSIEESVSLTNPGGNITTSITPETCAGDMNGGIDLTIADVAEPFTVEWTGPGGFTSNSEDLSGLAGGEYTYVITGADGCILSETLEVPAPDALVVDIDQTNTCFGVSEGSISLDISGGEEPYTISWTGPDGFASSEDTLENLAAGTYDLSVQDDTGCPFTATVEIEESPELSATVLAEDISCFGLNDGSIDLSVSGGVSPFAIEWNGPGGFNSTQEDLTDLEPGSYSFIVLDAFGCVVQDSVIITEPEELLVVSEVTATGCEGGSNSGSVSLFPEGGTPGYAVTWTGPNGFSSSFFDIVNLSPGIYDYEVIDQAGCSVTGSIEIIDVEPLEVEITTAIPDCFADSSGSIEAQASGGNGSYSYAWIGPDGFSSDQNPIENIPSGNYQLTLSDEAGCELTETVELGQPDSLTIEFASTASTCENSQDGTLSAVVAGGTPNYIYSWSGPDDFNSNSSALTDLAPGAYVLEVTDENECSAQDSTAIDVLFNLEVNAGPDTSFCPSDLPVSLTGAAEGGDIFFWTLEGDTLAEDATIQLTDTLTGVLDLILIGSNGACSETDTVEVEILESPDVDAGSELRVFVEETFTLGGEPTSSDDVTYFWSPNPTGVFDQEAANPTGFLMESETFTLVVTDENGCTARDTVFVEVLPDLEVNTGFTPNGDGVNDLWIIDNIELFPDMTVHVYNRWGVEVFESQGYNANIAWDGTYNGSILPSGTYYYAIELNDERFPEPLTGPLTLHR